MVVTRTLIFVVVFCALPVSKMDCYAWVQVQMLLNIMDNGLSTNHIVAVGYITNKESGEFLSLMEEHSLVTKGRVLGATGYIQAHLEFNASDS